MNISKKKGSNFLQTISNKIATMESAYEIDEEYPKLNNNKNPTNLNTSNPELIQENNNINNILLKESIISPNDINTNNLKESNISQNEIQHPSPQSLSSINSVYCKYHNKTYLKLDQNTFEIVCEKCLEEGNKSQLEIDTNISSENSENIYDTEFNCYKHNEVKGSFYCDECKEFICKMCFAEEHRKHKCHLPEVIRKEFIEQLDESLNNSSELTPVFNENIIDIKRI